MIFIIFTVAIDSWTIIQGLVQVNPEPSWSHHFSQTKAPISQDNMRRTMLSVMRLHQGTDSLWICYEGRITYVSTEYLREPSDQASPTIHYLIVSIKWEPPLGSFLVPNGLAGDYDNGFPIDSFCLVPIAVLPMEPQMLPVSKLSTNSWVPSLLRIVSN